MGDYTKKTATLSLAEHGAYNLLLDEIYSTERALPGGYEALHRICRAMSRAEQDAVHAVADRFFPIGLDGLRRNPRADEEISIAKPAITAAKTNGVKGGRPKKNPVGLIDEPTGGHPPTTNHQPLTTKPPSKSKGTARKRAIPLPDDFKISDRVKTWAAEKGFDRIDDHLEAFKRKCAAKGYEYLDHDAAFMEAIREDWAKLRSNGKGGVSTGPVKAAVGCGNCSKPITGGWTQSPKGRVCDECYRGYMGAGWPMERAAA